MDDYLYYLAQSKYNMYMLIHKRNPSVSRSDDCFERIKQNARYEQLLQDISFLPNDMSQNLTAIEKEHFSDAPYVTK